MDGAPEELSKGQNRSVNYLAVQVLLQFLEIEGRKGEAAVVVVVVTSDPHAVRRNPRIPKDCNVPY